MRNLNDLYLNQTRITDNGLAHLKDMSQIQNLLLRDTQITDVGMTHLKSLTNLKLIALGGTQITDDGLLCLRGASGLETLDFPPGAGVTREGYLRLKQSCPNLNKVGTHSSDIWWYWPAS